MKLGFGLGLTHLRGGASIPTVPDFGELLRDPSVAALLTVLVGSASSYMTKERV